MGGTRTHPQGLKWVCWALFCALLLHANTRVSADSSQEDSDLVFDNLDLPNLKHHRIAREVSSSYNEAISSQPEEDNWLTRTVNKVKRSIGSLFSNEEHAHLQKNHHQEASIHQYSEDSHSKVARNSRQIEYDEPDEEDDYGQEEDDTNTLDGQFEDNHDETNFYGNKNDNIFENFQSGSEDLSIGGGPGVDDEEDDADDEFGSGKDGGSGEIVTSAISVEPPENPEISSTTYSGPPHPVYYRFLVTVAEFYQSDFEDRDSEAFQELARKMENGVRELFSSKQGDQQPTVISIEKDKTDNFKMGVTVDLKSIGWYDSQSIENFLYQHVRDQRRIGDAIVTPDNFKFRPFEECEEHELTCNSKQCVDRSARCNGIRECNDNSDEIGCPSITTTTSTTAATPRREYESPTTSTILSSTTTTTEIPDIGSGDGDFVHRADDVESCADGTGSYYGDQKCDGTKQCLDGSDEENCMEEDKCAQGEFSCDLTRCLPLNSRCDGLDDCTDKTDEQECEMCTESAFHCDNTKCILKDQVCDHFPNCRDGTDERECSGGQVCDSSQFSCGNGQCISNNYRCTGRAECSNGADERNCGRLEDAYFRCGSGEHILKEKRCDREYDCADQSDEKQCPCLDTDFFCNSGICIPYSQRCDGIRQCQDQSDEFNCEKMTTTTRPHLPSPCYPNQIQCRDGTCVNGARCDRTYDCLDGTDEENCQYCEPSMFQCRSGGCIDLRLKCDRLNDCKDGSDEENCECRDHEFDCGEGVCVDLSMRCDQHYDCPRGNDEINCDGSEDSKNITNHPCTEDEFHCGGGECISLNLRCDLYTDCKNSKADEENCDCQHGEFRCPDGECIPQLAICDGNGDCSDNSDEANCRRSSCSFNEFRCERDNQCIPSYQRCDRNWNCADGSDEVGCDCLSHEFQCSNGQCVDQRVRCNGRPDCSDYSDEYLCPVTTEASIPFPPVTVAPTSCPFGYVSCLSEDQCILQGQLCDGRVDCLDMSDESRCEAGADGLQLRTYPSQQDIKENQEVVFQCRDEGPIRARVEWRRANGLPLPPGSRDLNGRLEMPNIKVEHGGTYVCVAKGYPPGTPGAEIAVQLHVDKVPEIYIPPPVKCFINESTCANGDCISRNKVCDGQFDCSDGSDEIRCRQCEPNEFKCDNKKCVSAVWKCDGQDDCSDGSDERFCQASILGQGCGAQQYTCRNDQCVPRSFHCDGYPDCIDKSDEIGCTPPVIAQGPPSMVTLSVGQTFTITCRAVGVPTPQIMWRLNWHHVPSKCRMTSVDGFGTLICENIQMEDQGAYSCEALSSIKTVFASVDTILTVTQRSPCRAGYFNVEARAESECIKCFCFGHTSNCRSADLFIFQFQPPFDSLKLLGARIDPRTGVVDIRDEPIYKGVEPVFQHVGTNGVVASLPFTAELNQRDVVPYFALPENYNGNQLKSYGGYLKYTVLHGNSGRPIEAPDVIVTGNNYILLHESRTSPQPHRPSDQRVRFFEGDWIIKSESQRPRPATREEIMMVLEDVSHILIKLEYNGGLLNTTLSNIEMDSAAIPDSGLGIANYVEECSCPVGYTGTSCESCADGFSRHQSGQWLGQCYKEPQDCQPGSYFDGRECQVCPCPYTSPSNQFARTCRLNTDGNVVCDCQQGYTGLRCEHCAPGFVGNPLQPGDYCRPSTPCDPQGTLGQDIDGRCLCKEYTTGSFCNQCKPNTFYLSSRNQFGCISCFCMGVSQQCTSSNWYRDTIGSVFTSSTNEFRLTGISKEDAFTQGLRLNQDSRELLYSSFAQGQPDVYYWALPNKYLGDKVTSYGGYLKYTIRNTPVPGGASSRNNAPDVELVSANRINLQYFANQTQSTNAPQSFEVPLLEQYWQRNDGVKTDREHLLMALADVQGIYIKATYYTNTQEAALISVSLDTAVEHNTGRERAFEVEQCYCPPGHTGLSCEDCAFGYTRSDEGIYLELCVPCECNGYSNECDPETGVCRNCRNNTAGDQCDQCLPGFTREPNRGQCVPHGHSVPCSCDPKGSTYLGCTNGVCQCKANVEGPNCDRCRKGTFGLSADNIEGCEFCFCSGVSTECSQSQLYVEQIPVQITDDHGFILTDQYFRETIKSDFKTNLAMNEIGYNFRPSIRERMYWSLPSIFTGNQIKSYGGKLEYMQRYIELPHANYFLDKDIIITGNNVVIYWTNPIELRPEIVNSVSARIHPSANWNRLDQNRAPKSASREDILTVLANIDTILIRATPSTDTSSTFLSDITLDTAVEVYTAKPLATSVETCRCPPGYRGTSCESCASGYYRDLSYSGTNPLGSCRKCPCTEREESCQFDQSLRGVVCYCLPGYTGRYCEQTEIITTTRRPNHIDPTPFPPSIEVVITGHNIEIYQIGSSLRLNCSAISRISQSTLRVDWSKDSDRLPYHAIDDGTGILLIRNLTASDSGRYICRADDGFSVVTESIVIVVGEGSRDVAPTMVLSEDNITANEGQLIEIRCSATGNPSPEFFLSRIDRQVLNPTHTFENGVFRILQARATDAGQYQCTAINRVGQDSKTFEVQVTSGSIIQVKIDPPYFDGQTGDEIVLRCIAERAQNIRWSKDNGPLPYQYRDQDGVLIIPNAQPSDSGRYICTATSYDGTRGSQYSTVNIRGGGGVRPSVRIVPDTLTLRQGERSDVKCEALGVPTPSVKWSKVNGVLGGGVEQRGNNLQITNAKIENRGVYVCVVSNDYGMEQASARIEVTRFEAPLVQILPEGGTISVTSGNTAQLQCRVINGYPAPTVTWSRENGRPLSSNVEILTGGNFRIIDITPTEGGEYVCSATNEAGTATAVAHITVYIPPRLTTTPKQDTITKAVNDHLQLACYGTGEPQPSVSWVKSTSPEYYKVAVARGPGTSDSAFMEFTHLRPDDAGVYVCIGRNEAGVVERRVQLDILPERGDNPGGDQGFFPSDHVQEFVAITGNRAELRCSVNTSHPENQYFVDWVRPNEQHLPPDAYSTQGNLFIDNVQPSAEGEYECITYELPHRNVLFRLRSRLRVLSPPRITLHPIRQVVAPGQNAYIRCNATGDQPIDIHWVPVNRTLPSSVYTADGYIRFNNIHHSDAGNYRCVARNSAGEADSVSEVVVAYEPEIHQPSIETENHRVTSAPGNDVSLRCRRGLGTESYPVTWNREGAPLPDNARLDGPILRIFDLRKDNEGRYFCEIETPGGLLSDYVFLDVSGPSVKSLPELPALHITPETRIYQEGTTIDINCQSNEPGVIPVWAKLGGGLADNVQNRAGRLTIHNARSENSGSYRCEATGQQGNYYKDHDLSIKAPDDPLRDEVPLQVQRAKRGATVMLECSSDLEPPVTYFWSKQGGSLPYYVDEYSKTITLNSVGAIDAGTYICSVTNQRRTLDVPIVLVVTGIIPYFTQAPNSYVTLPTLADAYLQFSFEISFKPENDHGLILYNGNRDNDRDGDFISLALDNGVPEFRFNLGPGTPTTAVRGNKSVADREWHTIKVVRNKKRVIMFVDGKGPFIGENEGKYFGLDLSEPLFLGGVPNYNNISPEMGIDTGLVGCISKFKIGYVYQDILHDSLNSSGITNCETCTESKCQNQGTCQEALTTEGYTCICPPKFSGSTCNKRKGEACSPYSCGIGKCTDTDYSFVCQCPLGRSGRQCEKTVQVYEPAFRDNAYIAYPPPRPLKRTKIEMRIKPRKVDDALLLYAAETNEGHGDFVSLTIKDKHLEFRFDNGKGPVVIRSDQEIQPNKWTTISAIRAAQDGRIIVNGHPSAATRFSAFFKTLTLLTPLYVGGYDQYSVRLNQGVKVKDGFNGCIVDINISGLDDAMMKNITDSSNVEDCGTEEDIDNGIPTGYLDSSVKPVSYDNRKTGCSDEPCKNNALCTPLSPVEYKCICPAAFSGKNCDIPIDLCKDQPCRYDGICRQNATGFTCDCPLGYGGFTCEQRIELRNDAHFDGNSWLAFSKNLLPHRHESEPEIIALELSTNKSNGLIFWHGQNPQEDGQGQDYISLALSNGYLEFSYDLGSGPAILNNTQVKVDDGERHSIILKREGRSGSIDVDHTYLEEGKSEGRSTTLDCNGNIYLGGTPNVTKMTGGRFASGFEGCIHGFELQQSKTLDLGMKAIDGLNVKPCSSFSDIDNNIWNEELIK